MVVGQQPANPKMSFFLKCENFQRTRAFKVWGSFHAMLRLIQTKGIDEVRRSGVITHSAGTVVKQNGLSFRLCLLQYLDY
jgi:threonine dehydratase